jgi:hypothetical protein
MVEGRSKQLFKTWLCEREETCGTAGEVVAMDGFAGFTTAALEELAEGVTWSWTRFSRRPAGQGLELCRRRIQLATTGRRGRSTTRCIRLAAP